MSPVDISYDEAFPSKWVKAQDIPDDGNLILTVEDVTFEPVGQDRDMKMVLRFLETEKGLVVNKTNANTLRQLFGNDPNTPIGRKIALFAQPVSYGGQTTLGVRVNPRLPGAKPARKSTMQTVMPPEPEFPEDEVYDQEMVV